MYIINNMNVIVANDYEDLSQVAAKFIADDIIANPNSSYGFATGSTPISTYKNLIKLGKEKNIDFSNISSFNLDEYYPIEKNNNQSYDYFMKQNLFNHININHENIHIPNGEATNIELECTKYEELIKEKGPIRIQLLGIGLNGHIGFNEPNINFSTKTHVVKLDKTTIDANSRFFENVEMVPTMAITMGIKTIMMAQKILVLGSGLNKSEIIYKSICGDIVTNIPASVLQLHKDVTFILDKDAASLLPLN